MSGLSRTNFLKEERDIINNVSRSQKYFFKNTSSFNLPFSQSSHACTANEEFEFYLDLFGFLFRPI